MISAGIDVGTRNTKIVVFENGNGSGGNIRSQSMILTGGDIRESSGRALDEALTRAGLSRADVQSIVATGAGKRHVGLTNEKMTEAVCDAKGITWLFPSVRTVIDVGAEQGRGIRCDASGKVIDFVTNEKCAAGVGAFAENMSWALETKLDDMESLARSSQNKVDMNITCVVFAESEVVSLIHSGVPKQDIVRAILHAIASRTTSMLNRLGMETEVSMIGGVSTNGWVIDFAKEQLGVPVRVPENPYMVGALGAALLAQH
ncbi:MAG: acyl-CoA dehydratase activase [Dehalococcoidia bacterium]|nr:acyl-CoA dehydratase activase [Dehalococcoidia bacterium]